VWEITESQQKATGIEEEKAPPNRKKFEVKFSDIEKLEVNTD
jgi:hypothetical protein